MLFDVDSPDLRPEAQSLIRDFVTRLIRALPEVEVVVVGHTDSLASDAYNLELSEGRADSFVAAAVEHGWPASQILPCGRGELDPVGDDMPNGEFDPVVAQDNRRVEVWLAPAGADPECSDLEEIAEKA